MSGGAADPGEVRSALCANEEIGLLDVRPEATFATGHPLFAASSPLDRLEMDILDRVPRLSTPLVVYGEEDTDAAEARHQLTRLGYTDVRLLEGGVEAWRQSGGELFADVNAPSKAFGELVAVTAATPQIEAGDLRRLLDDDATAVVVLDARRWDEYQTMSIPRAINVPGAGLVGAVGAVAADPSTLVVVQCAGRTRSLIGAQSLIDAGVANRVVALRNGTIGWTLAGLPLEHRQARAAPPVPPDVARRAAAAAQRVAGAAGVGRITLDDLDRLRRGSRRTIYCFDVRSSEEFVLGHVVGFRPAPGGQLVQETDRYAPVRGALIVLSEDDTGRADMTGAWLAQMGWSVLVLVAPTARQDEAGDWSRRVPAPPAAHWLSADSVASAVSDGAAIVVDIDFSSRYRAGHIPGAYWARRAALRGLQGGVEWPARAMPPMIITSEDDTLTALTCRDLGAGSGRLTAGLKGGTRAWIAAGRPVEAGDGSPLCPVNDLYRRPYEGTDVDPPVMQAYLDWEYGLVAQLQRDGTHRFWVLGAPR